ncbi:hypothetical protein JYU07_00840 [Roseiflexus sp. AH-315-K22]|nr:hypothetical protein [Roseiflexus sp. AH-315-K22]
MFARFLLILTFAVQPSWLAVGAQAAPMPDECGMMPCHEVVVTASCCGEMIVEEACGATGGDCLCEANFTPIEQPEPVPVSRTTFQVSMALAPRPAGVTIVWPTPTRYSSRSATEGRAAPSHNTVQALLGVWRT